jgi:uncharacterized membrane protein (DUF2068 family)
LGIIVVSENILGVGSGSRHYSDPSGLTQLIEGAVSLLMAAIMLLIEIIIIVLAIPLLIAGYGLIKMRRWSRIFGIIISIITLFGGIGIYGLWVLTRKESKDIFKRKSIKKDLIQNPDKEMTADEKELLKQLPDKGEVDSLNKYEVIDMKMHKHYKILGSLFIVSVSDTGLLKVYQYAMFHIITIFLFPLASLIAGFGLKKFKTWSRIFGIIISVISLIGFPLGTAIGIYGLWVLTRKGPKVIQSSS